MSSISQSYFVLSPVPAGIKPRCVVVNRSGPGLTIRNSVKPRRYFPREIYHLEQKQGGFALSDLRLQDFDPVQNVQTNTKNGSTYFSGENAVGNNLESLVHVVESQPDIVPERKGTNIEYQFQKKVSSSDMLRLDSKGFAKMDLNAQRKQIIQESLTKDLSESNLNNYQKQMVKN